MIDKVKLINSLAKLESELRKTGRDGTADFFEKSIVTIKLETDANKLKQILEQICSSGAMSQYVNFSYREDELFDDCLKRLRSCFLCLSEAMCCSIR